MYLAKGKKLEDIVLSLLDRNVGQNHHICHDDVYNSVRLAQTLLDRNVRVCGTLRTNGKSDVMVQVWKDRRLVQMLSTIRDTTIVDMEERQENKPGNKEALCFCPVQ